MTTAEELSAPASTGAGLPPLTALPRRILKHPRLMHYNRLIALVLAANLALLAHALPGGIATASLSRAALANFALAIVIRQQYVVNLLFRLATSAPVHWPLRIRWTLAKVYHFGGLHVGGALAGTAWFLGFVAALTVRGGSAGALTLSYAIVALLTGMIATALPRCVPAATTASSAPTASAAGPPSPCSGSCSPSPPARRSWPCWPSSP